MGLFSVETPRAFLYNKNKRDVTNHTDVQLSQICAVQICLITSFLELRRK